MWPEDDPVWTREILAWAFGRKLNALFGEPKAGADPPLLRLHCIARGEWQLLLSAWARDRVIASNQNQINLEHFDCWVLKRMEAYSGLSAVIS